MTTFEDTLTTRLHQAAATATVRPELEHMIEARLRETPKRQQPHAAFAVLAVAALLVGTVALVARSASQRSHRAAGPSTSPVSRGEHLAPGWSPLPTAPIQPRSEYVAVWTGKEMIVWGGYNGDTAYSDGATYSPTTRKWADMAPGPLAAREDPLAVWTGKAMLIFGGGSAASYSDGAAYYPATNTWRKLARIPQGLGGNLFSSGSYAVWTGREMLVCGFFGNGPGAHGGGSLDAATYDPATNKWAAGPAAPEQAPLFGDAFWTGKEMLAFGPSSDDNIPEGLAFNPSTSKWSVLASPPLASGQRDSMLAVWTGSEMVIGGGATETGVANDAAAYNPVANSWQRLPDAPVGFTGNNNNADIWTGKSVITVEDDIAGGKPLSLALASKRWSFGPKAPIPGRQEAEELWTGTTILVWGGGDSSGTYCCQAIRQGYAYTPPIP